ncbi:hypothetical protein [Aurantiacibacter spongiae]|uniref:Uncharacterized protein n=1 Tax=Aurantiacibacter spongiae TaxID=2488860 RepID=A0A3N5DT93_9SPHN|nr:hypothetical protein [Aurantiacibacter spongiae]RPF72561.1 hypothetical protein EG799_13690 [Aurantiacibacter spongiae]
MLRQLLTLLAVISGLTLAAEPVGPAQASVISIATSAETDACKPVTVPTLQVSREPATRRDDGRRCRQRVPNGRVPTVMLRADRAHE